MRRAAIWALIGAAALPGAVRAAPCGQALVIEGGGTEVSGGGTLADWYRAEVLRGPDAFAEIAAGFSDFERAMVAKLLRELSETRIGQGGAGGGENG